MIPKYFTLCMLTKGKICDKHMQKPHLFLHIQNRQEHMQKEHIPNM
jgi:hypothetical protein